MFPARVRCATAAPPLFRLSQLRRIAVVSRASRELPRASLAVCCLQLRAVSRRSAHTTMPLAKGYEEKKAPTREPNRLILCFDGTGNVFQGNTSDTNIVKLLDMFDRSAPKQMHYYQPGIGTYSEGSVNTNIFGRIARWFSQTIDSGLATSFDSHVIAGYRFLMRYYGTGDKIYIFGFSRGAFTARFVARMIAHVGLLSMGNEEMVPFAYKVYQDYEMGKDPEGKYMKLFRRTFCRHGHEHAEAEEAESSGKNGTTPAADCAEDDDDADAQGGVKVHFLGLFDTVNSVGTFDTPFGPTTKPAEVAGTAHHVRHAVAIDERRVKFKAALLAQDKQKGAPPQTDHDDGSDDEDSETSALMPHGHTAHAPMKEDIREVWFPGNHGDIGGGWPADNEAQEPGMWASFKKIFFKAENPKKDDSVHLDKTDDWFQLSDVPLRWMVAELEAVEAAEAASNKADKSPGVTWNVKNKNDFFDRFNKKRHWAITGRMHDTMRVGGGSDFGKVLLWKFMEVFPLIRRWEYFADKAEQWQYVRFPLNMGGCRDIPPGALFHHAVLDRMAHFPPGITTMQVTNKDGAIENKTVKPYLPHNDANVRSEGRVLRPRPLRVAGVPPSEITDPAVNVKKDRPAKAGEPYFVWSESNTLGGKSAAVTDRVYRLRCD